MPGRCGGGAEAVRGRQVIAKANDEIKCECVGGPLDGSPHYRAAGNVLAIHQARGRWAVYVVRRNGRAEFCGYAANRKQVNYRALGL